MTKASRVPVIGILLIGVICPSARVSAQQRPAIADQIAKTYGLDSWDQVEAIRYTFNVDWPALRLKTSRSWVWEPKTDRVSYDGKDKDGNPVKVTYSRSQLASQSAVVKNEIDPAFNNDQYNLLFAFHIVWDTSATVQDAGKQKLPLGKGSAEKVEMNYPSEGGYTPADAWTLYVGNDGRVRELEIHRVNAPPSVYLTTFAMHAITAAKILDSAWVAAALLLGVAIGMIVHSLRYHSQTVTGLAYFIAFVSSCRMVKPMSSASAITGGRPDCISTWTSRSSKRIRSFPNAAVSAS